MVNGPPTPPPTNAAELQDEQRGNPSSALPDTSDAEITQDEYRYILPTIEELASKGNFHDVILVAERSDLNVRPFVLYGTVPTNLHIGRR